MKNPRPDFFAEPLEPRRLLAGVTILIHGNDGNITGWVAATADMIAKRTGNAAQVSQYVMKVGDDSNKQLAVLSFKLTAGPQLNRSSLAEAVVKLDWTDVDDGSVSTAAVGKVVANYLVAPHGKLRALAELPIHLIGHSRGASLGVAISGQLALRGIWVDQNTFLDPHPVDGHNDFLGADFGDTSMKVYDNVIFADDYWRQSGTNPLLNFSDPDGEAVTGAHNLSLQNSVEQQFIGSAHIAVPAYYDGTIDFNAISNNDHPIFSSWYGQTAAKPARNATGYLYSRIVGGTRPADGLGTAFGGSAARVAVAAQGAQWSNLTNMATNASTFRSGAPINVSFLREDRDSASTVTLYLDKDTDPYNGTNAATLSTTNLRAAASVTASKIKGAMPAAASGTYYVCARISDADGHVRFAYSKPITLKA